MLLLAASPASSAASSLNFGPCSKGTEFSCATLPVPLDRTGALPGTVTLNVERRLVGTTPTHSAVIALAGGPGQAATPLAEFIAKAISPALESRDLLVFDQRGTGASGPLSCSALSSSSSANRASSPEQLIELCAHELGPARADYTTAESVADIEALRQAGGYEKIVLYGTSYGTKVALDYAERYPQHVESLVLDSTETPTGPEAFHLATFKAMTPALRELCSHGGCSGVTGNPVADLAKLVSRLGTHPLKGVAYGQHGKAVKLSLTRSELYSLLLGGDLNPALRSAVPSAIRSAITGDPNPLLRLLALAGVGSSSGEESSEVDETLFIDTSCEETPFPWQRGASEATRAIEAEAALNALPSADFYPFDREAGLLDQTIPLCVSWPDAAPAPPAEAALPNVPTLILSGGQDLRTPTENARAVAKLIPDAQILIVPYTGHSVIGSDFTECSREALISFFSGVGISPCASTANEFPPAPLAPKSLASVPTTHGVAGTPGRTLTAAVDSVRDLERALSLVAIDAGALPSGARFGGLRGGDARITKTSIVLSHYTYIPGVQVSGTISTKLLLTANGPEATLTIGGSAATGGIVRLSTGHRFSGVLGGHAFSVKLTATTADLRAAQLVAELPEPFSLPSPALARQP